MNTSIGIIAIVLPWHCTSSHIWPWLHIDDDEAMRTSSCRHKQTRIYYVQKRQSKKVKYRGFKVGGMRWDGWLMGTLRYIFSFSKIFEQGDSHFSNVSARKNLDNPTIIAGRSVSSQVSVGRPTLSKRIFLPSRSNERPAPASVKSVSMVVIIRPASCHFSLAA